MIDLSVTLGIQRLYALCHTDHLPSAHVLEKAGFTREKLLPNHTKFPNLGADSLSDVFCYGLTPAATPSRSR